LAVVERKGAPLIVSGDDDGVLRSWRLDGTPGELQVGIANRAGILALAVVERKGAPLIITGGIDGIRSWRLGGTPGELQVSDVHVVGIHALAVAEHDGAPLIISGGLDGALRSWRLDGTPGELQVSDAHLVGILALAVIQDGHAPLVVSADGDGRLRSWSLASPLVALERATARAVEVRELSLSSLDLVVLLPPDVLTTAAATVAGAGVAVMKLSKILDAIKRVAGFTAELRIQRREQEIEELIAEAELLEAADRLTEARARHRRRQLEGAGWEFESVIVTDDDDDALA
jgi:hypothetical protein